PTITHLGLLVIIFSSLSGNLGYQGYMQLFEGETSDIVHLREGKGVEKLDFSVRCDKFDLEFYPDSERPKAYKSALAIIENGKEVKKKVIVVNDPLVYRGIFFYQSSYGADMRGGGEVILRVSSNDNPQGREYRASPGKSFRIENSDAEVWLDDFVPDFAMNEQGKPFSRSDQPRNPAVSLRVLRSGKETQRSWVFKNYPDFHKKSSESYEFKLIDCTPREYTGLQVTRDPGVLFVWTGCLLLVAGIYFAFFTSHRRVWLRVEEAEGKYTAVLAGSCSKNLDMYKEEFDKLAKSLKA
ncbi:MAG: cytochrome c biogenesis protein ResB, partial [Pseudomonadota bacterium]